MTDPRGPAGVPTHRTYHARRGRLSAAKRRALDELGPRFSLRPSERPDVVDLGCGSGELSRHLARTRPDLLVVAVDVHSASVATLLRDAADEELGNLRVHHGDGVDLLRRSIEPATLVLLAALFPDPWPKARHRHRRLVQPGFATLAAGRLADHGTLHLATDRDDYAAQMRQVLTDRNDLEAVGHTAGDREPAGDTAAGIWPVTFYEARARAAGRTVHRLAFARLPRTGPPCADLPGTDLPRSLPPSG